jgi:hypothetical protein
MPRDAKRGDDPLPDVRRFIERCIDDIEQLETLLLLHRKATRYWDAAMVAQALNLPERLAADALEALGRRGFFDVRITSAVMYRFNPTTRESAEDVARLADVYKEHRRTLFVLLTSRRRRSLKDFADAFKMSKDSDDG